MPPRKERRKRMKSVLISTALLSSLVSDCPGFPDPDTGATCSDEGLAECAATGKCDPEWQCLCAYDLCLQAAHHQLDTSVCLQCGVVCHEACPGFPVEGCALDGQATECYGLAPP